MSREILGSRILKFLQRRLGLHKPLQQGLLAVLLRVQLLLQLHQLLIIRGKVRIHHAELQFRRPFLALRQLSLVFFLLFGQAGLYLCRAVVSLFVKNIGYGGVVQRRPCPAALSGTAI